MFLVWHKSHVVSPLLIVFMQKAESEVRQAQEALSAGEKRTDASKQELGRLRRTADNARKETQTAREEVKVHLIPVCASAMLTRSIMISCCQGTSLQGCAA